MKRTLIGEVEPWSSTHPRRLALCISLRRLWLDPFGRTDQMVSNIIRSNGVTSLQDDFRTHILRLECVMDAMRHFFRAPNSASKKRCTSSVGLTPSVATLIGKNSLQEPNRVLVVAHPRSSPASCHVPTQGFGRHHYLRGERN